MPKPPWELTPEEVRDLLWSDGRMWVAVAELISETRRLTLAECAAQYRVCDNRRHELAGLLHDAVARAVLAEQERDEALKRNDPLLPNEVACAWEAVGMTPKFPRSADAIKKAITAALADAKRQGGYEALTKLWNIMLRSATGFVLGDVLKFRDRNYAPPAPAGVELGEWVVTYDGTYFCAECKGAKMARSTVITLCHNLGIIPTADEYAALLRLADKGDTTNG